MAQNQYLDILCQTKWILLIHSGTAVLGKGL